MPKITLKTWLAAMALCVSPALLLGQWKQVSHRQPLVFTHVTVIDTAGGPAKPDMTVVIVGSQIIEVGKTGKVRVPKGAQLIDATRKYLIPGLWDMHVHVWDRAFFPLFVANGITGVRDVGTSRSYEEQFKQWRGEIATGRLLGPRIVASGLMVDGPNSPYPGFSILVTTEAEAQQAVKTLKNRGAQFIKVQSLIPRPAYFALADETKKQGLGLVGHVPFVVSAAEASDGGQQSIEHLTNVFLGCSTREQEFQKALQKATATSVLSLPDLIRLLFFFPSGKELDNTYDQTKAAALFARFVRNGTWQVPTFTLWRSYAFIQESRSASQARLRYLPQSLRKEFDQGPDYMNKDFTPEDFANSRTLFKRNLELAGAMRRAGVGFLAGTDAAATYNIPGFSLHDELALLVEAGFTPMEALQTATRNPAKFLGELDTLGTVETGRVADLVLLDANPLEDIHNTQKIRAVIVDGRYLGRAELDRILAQVAAVPDKK